MSTLSINPHILEHISHLLYFCKTFSQPILSFDRCQTLCIINLLQDIFKQIQVSTSIISQDLWTYLNTFSNLEAFSYFEILNIIFVQSHQHVTEHLNIPDCSELCPFHRSFYIHYKSDITCDCTPSITPLENVESLAFTIKFSNMPGIPPPNEMIIGKYARYLDGFYGKAFEVYSRSKNCFEKNCRKVPTMIQKAVKHGTGLVIQLVYETYPQVWEILRFFCMFPFVLNMQSYFAGGKGLYKLLGYFVVSSNKSGCMIEGKSTDEWIIRMGSEVFSGNYPDMLEKLISNSFLPVALFYVESSSKYTVPSKFFCELQKKLNSFSKSTKKLSLPSMGKFIFKSSYSVQWTCECKTINTSPYCKACTRVAKFNKYWICECSISNINKKCVCGKEIPKCLRCLNLFSWYDFCCLCCEGVVENEICTVCGLKNLKSMCFWCRSKHWRCSVCFYMNIDTAMCLRCYNPNENVVEMEFIETPSYALLKLNEEF